MSRTIVEISPRGDRVSCVLAGELVIPRVIRRHARCVDIALVAGRAMLLPGDEVQMDITVGDGCTLNLVDIGGLVVYGRVGEDAPSHWHIRIVVGTDAHLTWDGLPTVITDAGRLTRSLTVSLGRGSSSTVRETLVLGRAQEHGGHVTTSADIVDSAGPILRETLAVSGLEPVPGVLGSHRVVDSILAFGDRRPLAEVDGAVRLDLDRGGTVLRHLGDAAHLSPLGDAWREDARSVAEGPRHERTERRARAATRERTSA